MIRDLLAGAAVMLAIAAGPALAQEGMKGSGFASPNRARLDALPREATTPAERAQVRRDWNEMAREWEARQNGHIQRSQAMPPQSNRGGDVRGRARADEAHRFGRRLCPASPQTGHGGPRGCGN